MYTILQVIGIYIYVFIIYSHSRGYHVDATSKIVRRNYGIRVLFASTCGIPRTACRSDLLFLSKFYMWEDDLNQGFSQKSGTLRKICPKQNIATSLPENNTESILLQIFDSHFVVSQTSTISSQMMVAAWKKNDSMLSIPCCSTNTWWLPLESTTPMASANPEGT